MILCTYIAPGQGQTTPYDGPKAPILHTKPQGHWPFGSGEDFLAFFTIYRRFFLFCFFVVVFLFCFFLFFCFCFLFFLFLLLLLFVFFVCFVLFLF